MGRQGEGHFCVCVGGGVLQWEKISAPLWRGPEPAIAINERKRPVREHKGEKGTITDWE